MANQLHAPFKPQTLYCTDGGIETDLLFNHKMELPDFSIFPLLQKEDTFSFFRRYWINYLEIASSHKCAMLLETPTWRASKDWINKFGISESEFHKINEKLVSTMKEVSKEYPNTVLGGNIGPRGDGYSASNKMTTEESRSYHAWQIGSLAKSGVQIIAFLTANYKEEALGVALACKDLGIPVIISYTVETNGKLPTDDSLEEAISFVEEGSGSYPLFYGINCAHPSHFMATLKHSTKLTQMIRLVRANSSKKSHQELDEATELDVGDKDELSDLYKELKNLLPRLQIVGGCCGTDSTHIELILEKIHN